MPACSMKSRARGLSLIEVVVGMALLGVFLASIFIAQARLISQSAIARKKAVAITATDSMLASWTMDWQNLPIDDTGTIPDHDNLQWTTTLIPEEEFEALGIQKIQLTITDSSQVNNDEPILQLELTVPIAELENPDGPNEPDSQNQMTNTSETETSPSPATMQPQEVSP